MILNFLQIDTMPEAQLMRVREDIKNRIYWNTRQKHLIEASDIHHTDYSSHKRISNYEEAILQYRADLLAISKLLP